jgi:hypothetical protein
MSGLGIQDKMMEAVVIMNAAVINLRLYPPTNALIVNTIDRLQEIFTSLFAEEEAMSLAESEKALLICGEPLSPKNQGKPQVAILLMLMINWGIKSLSFQRGLEKGELSHFLEIFGKRGGSAASEKGWEQLVSAEEIPHIRVNQKFYVERDRAALSVDYTEDEIIAALTAQSPGAVPNREQLKEMAQDPEWTSRILHAGIGHLFDKGEELSPMVRSEQLLRMLKSIDGITGETGKEKMSQFVAHSLSQMDAGLISAFLQQDMDGLLDDRLFERLVDGMECGQLEVVVGALRRQAGMPNAAGEGFDSEGSASSQQALQRLIGTNKGAECNQALLEKMDREKDEKEKRLQELKEHWRAFFAAPEAGLTGEGSGDALPEAIVGLLTEGESVAAEWLIKHLIHLLLNEKPVVRSGAARLLARLLESLSTQREDLLIRHLDRLLQWTASETVLTDAYRTIGSLLRELAQQWIRAGRLAEALPILEAFGRRHSSRSETEGGTRTAAAALLKEAATDDILEILLEEFRRNGRDLRAAAGRHLVLLAERSLGPLLDILKESEDSAERVRILNLIPEIGSAAVSAVIKRIDAEAAWYDLRNLARLLGHIGGEADAGSLAPLLGHSDPRVQREALKSIGGIGGGRRGEILIAALPGCNDQVKAAVVAVLGSLKHRPAVKPLIDLFKVKTALSAEQKSDLQEKICQALGNIGDREALPFLTEIGKSGGLFAFKSYPPKVKAAAVKAMTMFADKS